jgi:hypothetical protein
MECAELDAATTDQPFVLWSTLEDALQSCPYPALVEFNTHHARTLLDLAENAVDAALAAAAAAAPNGAGGGTASSSSSRNRSKGEAAGAPLVDVASELAGCLARCLYGGTRCLFTASADSLEAAGGMHRWLQLSSGVHVSFKLQACVMLLWLQKFLHQMLTNDYMLLLCGMVWCS